MKTNGKEILRDFFPCKDFWKNLLLTLLLAPRVPVQCWFPHLLLQEWYWCCSCALAGIVWDQTSVSRWNITANNVSHILHFNYDQKSGCWLAGNEYFFTWNQMRYSVVPIHFWRSRSWSLQNIICSVSAGKKAHVSWQPTSCTRHQVTEQIFASLSLPTDFSMVHGAALWQVEKSHLQLISACEDPYGATTPTFLAAQWRQRLKIQQ